MREGSPEFVSGLYRVPDLELDLFAVYCDVTGPEFDADCKVVDGLEALVCELQQQTRLAYTCKDRASID